MLTNQLSLKDIENYIQNVEKSKSDATNTEVNHPFFPLSPTHNEGYKKRNEILDNLIEKYSHDRDLRFVDLINLWTAEKDDNLTRFKQLRDETKLANEYFTDNPGASEITIYALSDGSFTTNPINNTDISIEDSRAFRKRRMEDLAQRISFYETEGADLKLDRYINLVQQMSNNKTVADLDKHDLSTFLTLQSERSTGKAREVFELLIAQVELYNYAV